MATTTGRYIEPTPILAGNSWAHQVQLQGMSPAGALSALALSDLTTFTLLAYDVATDTVIVGTAGVPAGAEPTPENLLTTLSPGGSGVRGTYDNATGTLTLTFHEDEMAMIGTERSEVHRALVVATYNSGDDATVYELTYTVQDVRHRGT